MKNILIISALAGVLALSSCRRDDLYYATVDRATVRIEADWTPARLTPNGVSAFVFDRNGAAFDVVRSNDSRKADLSLPEGSYSVVVLNNTLDEYRNIESAGTDRLETFALMGRAVSPNFTSLGGGTRAESFIGEPDTVAGSVVRNIEVTRKMIEYFRTKPHGMEPAPGGSLSDCSDPHHLGGRHRCMSRGSNMPRGAPHPPEESFGRLLPRFGQAAFAAGLPRVRAEQPLLRCGRPAQRHHHQTAGDVRPARGDGRALPDGDGVRAAQRRKTSRSRSMSPMPSA